MNFQAALEDLTTILRSDQISVNHAEREQHSHDESWHHAVLPDAVLYPESRDDVVHILRCASAHQVPVVPFAAGTSLEGHVIPVAKGFSLDMTRMNRILAIHPEDLLVQVQPGVTKTQLNDALRKYGLFFSVDPGSDATMGGMAGTNASGTTTVRYGVMRDQIRALEIVLADGSVIHTGSLAAKSSSGYHLQGLFIGSEGTLGVFTELWIRVYGIPEATVAVRAAFPTAAACVRTATAVVSAGIPVARMEFVDEKILWGINRYARTSFPEVPTLFFEFHGNPEGLAHDRDTVRAMAEEEGAVAFEAVERAEDRARLWSARHVAATAYTAQFPGKRHMSTDVCVPLSKLPDAIAHATAVMDDEGAPGGIVGHVGDGNFHAVLVLNPECVDEVERAKRVNARIVDHALAIGGTCTGEHGVGLGKRIYQAREHSDTVALMRSIKALLDPQGILNPGKLVDA